VTAPDSHMPDENADDTCLAVRLPAITDDQPTGTHQNNQLVAYSIWGRGSEKPWRFRILGPVLKSLPDRTPSASSSDAVASFGRILAPLGGPPRQLRKIDCAADPSKQVAIVPITEDSVVVSSRKLGRWPHKEEHKPIMPRMAVRRVCRGNPSSLQAITEGGSQSSRRCSGSNSDLLRQRPPSPLTVAEAVYTRDLLKNVFWRGNLEAEVAGRDAEFAEFASHRVDCYRAAQQQSREKAAQWREQQQCQAKLAELRWILQNNLPSDPEKYQAPIKVAPELECDPAQLNSSTTLQAYSVPPSSPQLEEVLSASSSFARQSSSVTDDPIRNASGVQVKDWSLAQLKLRPHGTRNDREKRIAKIRRHKFGKAISDYINDEERSATSSLKSSRLQPRGNDAQDFDLQTAKIVIASLPPKELQAYRIAFARYDVSGRDYLDYAQTRDCLTDLGLKACTEAEQDELRTMLRQAVSIDVTFNVFAGYLIPKVRSRLADLRRRQLREYFREADTYGKGYLSVQAMIRICNRLGIYPGVARVVETIDELIPGMAECLHSINGKLLAERDCLSLQQFELVVPVIQEQTESELAQKARDVERFLEFTPELKELWKLDLLNLYDAYQRYCDPHIQSLPLAEIPNVVQEVSLLPKNPNFRYTLQGLIEQVLEDWKDDEEAHLEFEQVFKVVTKLRKEERKNLMDIYRSHDTKKTGQMSLSVVQRVLQEAGMTTKNKKEVQELASILEEFDVENTGELPKERFLDLVQCVAERLRKLRCDVERDKVYSYGWSDKDCENMRMVFTKMDEDLSLNLKGQEVIRAVAAVRGSDTWTQADTENLLRELYPTPAGRPREVPKVDFIQFLDLIRAIDDRERHRLLGATLGIEKESIDHCCSVWRNVGPTADDYVNKYRLTQALKNSHGGALKLKRLKYLVPESHDKVPFTVFLQIMKRGELEIDKLP
jgi:Ca2+-binding EF-hand superfamily protein